MTTSLFIDSNENEKIGNETVADLEKGLVKELREAGYKKLEQVVSKYDLCEGKTFAECI